jgi:ferredoxin
MAEVDRERCMGCGVCVSTCPQGALELVRAADKCPPLEIQTLMQGAMARAADG